LPCLAVGSDNCLLQKMLFPGWPSLAPLRSYGNSLNELVKVV
jgi:hypothetical protein